MSNPKVYNLSSYSVVSSSPIFLVIAKYAYTTSTPEIPYIASIRSGVFRKVIIVSHTIFATIRPAPIAVRTLKFVPISN